MFPVLKAPADYQETRSLSCCLSCTTPTVEKTSQSTIPRPTRILVTKSYFTTVCHKSWWWMQNLLYFRFYGCPKTQLAPVQEHVFKRIFIIFQTPASINNTDHPWVLNHHRLDATHLQHQQLQDVWVDLPRIDEFVETVGFDQSISQRPSGQLCEGG